MKDENTGREPVYQKGEYMKDLWLSTYIEKPYKEIDMTAKEELVQEFKKYGNVRSVMKYINERTLTNAYHTISLVVDETGRLRTAGDKATGTDNISIKQYGINLNDNITNLITNIRNHTYKMKPVLRTYIPKAGKVKYENGESTIITGGVRPLSIICVEDTILQTCMVNQVIGPISEEIFTYESFAYRANRGVKEALNYLEDIITINNSDYILKIDIKGYFDNININVLLKMIKGIIKDRRFIGIIRHILETDYIDVKTRRRNKTRRGIYQGANISPVLANIYLHYVIDTWYNNINTKEDIYMVRYADDIIILGKNKEDMETAKASIRERLKEYYLTLSEEKTEIVNLRDKEIEFLGIVINKTKDGEVFKSISESKVILLIEEVRFRVSEVFDKDTYQINRNYKLYTTSINNKLVGIYKTYIECSNWSVLGILSDIAVNEIKLQLSNRLPKSVLVEIISHIISILDFYIEFQKRRRK